MKKSSGRRVNKTPVRRLERRHTASSSSSSSEDLSVSTDSLMTPSLEFPDRTSFRNFGGEDQGSSRDFLTHFVPEGEVVRRPSSSSSSENGEEEEMETETRFLEYADTADEACSFTTNEDGDSSSSVSNTSPIYANGEDQGSSRDLDFFTFLTPESEIVRRPSSLLGQTMEWKHINDDSSDEDLSVSTDSLMTPSMEFPDRISLRNLGGEDGEMDHQGSSWDSLSLVAPESEIVRRPSFSFMMTRFLQIQDRTNFRFFDTAYEGGDGGSIITSWQKGELLGRGCFASVYEGISGGGDFFAIKEVSLLEQGKVAQECIQQLEGEIALLSQLQHQNIVRYRGTAKDETNLYLFLELASQGSLSELYRSYQLADSVVSTYIGQILDCLKYLHDKSIIHRDIKCANILVDASGAVKLADFGLAKVSKLNDSKSCKGSAFWIAPEVINRRRTDGYGKAADIWSLGCTVLEMLTGQIPYCDLEDPVQALFRISKGVLPNIPDTLSLNARDFILKCLKANPEERATAAELVNHPFVRKPLSSSVSGLSTGVGSSSQLLSR